MLKRLDRDRRNELLDGVMGIIESRGFSDVRVSEMARELHCSVSTLYKIAPSKESLVLLAIERWACVTFDRIETLARDGATDSERARRYFAAGATSLHPFSLAFFADIERFESTREAWRTRVVDRYIDRFVELVQFAQDAGEVRPVNARFLAEMLSQIGLATRDERVLKAAGMTAEEAVLEVDRVIWDGIRSSPK